MRSLLVPRTLGIEKARKMSKNLISLATLLAVVAFVAACAVCLFLGGCPGQLTTSEGAAIPMKCHWCFRASAVVLAIGALNAVCLLIARSVEARRLLAVVAMALALGAILMNATPIIGICAVSDMHCHTTALAVNVCAAIACIASAFVCAKATDKPAKPKMGL